MNLNNGLPLVSPNILPPLDPGFRPAVLANQAFRATLQTNGIPVQFALERSDGSVSRFGDLVAAAGTPQAEGNFFHLERLLKFLLWSRGACKVHFAGPPEPGKRLQEHYRGSATGRFDTWIMGEKIYETPFEFILRKVEQLPPAKESSAALGRHLEGCRIGF